jgi:hypothetical protein
MSARRCPLAKVIKGGAQRAMARDLRGYVILIARKPQHLLGDFAPRAGIATVYVEDRQPPEHWKQLLGLPDALAKLARALIGLTRFQHRPAFRGELRPAKGQLQVQL